MNKEFMKKKAWNLFLFLLLVVISLLFLYITVDSAIRDLPPTVVALVYLVIYFRMIMKLSNEQKYTSESNTKQGQGILAKIKKRLLPAYIWVVGMLSSPVFIDCMYRQRWREISIASVLDVSFRYVILTLFMIGTFGFLIRRASMQNPDSTIQTVVLLIVFLSFSYRLSEKVLSVYPKLKRPLRDARIQVRYSNTEN